MRCKYQYSLDLTFNCVSGKGLENGTAAIKPPKTPEVWRAFEIVPSVACLYYAEMRELTCKVGERFFRGDENRLIDGMTSSGRCGSIEWETCSRNPASIAAHGPWMDFGKRIIDLRPRSCQGPNGRQSALVVINQRRGQNPHSRAKQVVSSEWDFVQPHQSEPIGQS